ncbi:MAG: spermidine/putrescine ABC transporter substrate-binding protein [Chthoniobacterales bacterium]|nr:spermidine/putrescine ABC transporter substrate-binding protein [Chthoniobacterales bacterium]
MKKRPFLMIAAFTATVLLAGCEKPDPTLRFLLPARGLPLDIIEQFSRESAIPVAVDTYATPADMLAKLSGGEVRYDVVQPPDYLVGPLVADKALMPLDPQKIPNLKNLDPLFSRTYFDPGNKFTVPWMAAFTGIVYNSEVVPPSIVRYGDVFTADWANRVVVIDEPREIVSWALAAAGIPVNDASDTNLSMVRPLLADWLAKVRVYDSNDPGKAIFDGEADIGVMRSEDAAILSAKNPRFQWVFPAEGARMFVEVLGIPAGSRHGEEAMRFLEFLLTPRIGVELSARRPGYNPNAAAREMLSDEQKKNPASYPTPFDVARAQLGADLGPQQEKVEALVRGLKRP